MIGHRDLGCMAARASSTRVVQDFVEAVSEATVVDRPDVHAGALTDTIEALYVSDSAAE